MVSPKQVRGAAFLVGPYDPQLTPPPRRSVRKTCHGPRRRDPGDLFLRHGLMMLLAVRVLRVRASKPKRADGEPTRAEAGGGRKKRLGGEARGGSCEQGPAGAHRLPVVAFCLWFYCNCFLFGGGGWRRGATLYEGFRQP